MRVISVEEAQAHLPELIAKLQPGDKIVIGENGSPLASLTRYERTSWPCQPGSAKQIPHWMAPDFDEPLEDFREYME